MNQFSFLFGFFFISIGSLLLAHNFYPFFEFESVWRLWPMILLFTWSFIAHQIRNCQKNHHVRNRFNFRNYTFCWDK